MISMPTLLLLVLLQTMPAAWAVNYCASNTAQDPLDVVVIGAGWSGLAAGRYLQWANRSFCIVEGRNAIGGRSRTHMNAFQDGLPTELGSAWIYAGSNVYRVFQDAGLVVDVPSPFKLNDIGIYGTAAEQNTDALRKAYQDFAKFAQKNANFNVSIQSLLDAYLQQNQQLPITTRQFIQGFATAMIHSEWGAYMDQGNSASLANSLTFDYTIYFTGVPGSGFSRALDFFAAPMMQQPQQQQQQHIRLNTPVVEIDYQYQPYIDSKPLVKITSTDATSNNNNNTVPVVHYAKAVLVTVPLGVLKHGDIRFVPALPAAKTKAIQDMGFANKNKCILYWDATTTPISWWPFLNRLDHFYFANNNQDQSALNQWTYFTNDQFHRGNENIFVLTAWIGGVQADAWERKSDAETIQYVMTNLRTMNPYVTIPDPTNYVLTRWKSDPFTRGTYSYYRVGVDYRSTAMALAEPINGNVFFAGEATAPGGMGAPNAFSSGERAVQWIFDSEVLLDSTTVPVPPTVPGPAPVVVSTPAPIVITTPAPLITPSPITIVVPSPVTAAPVPTPSPLGGGITVCGRSGWPCTMDSQCCQGFTCQSLWAQVEDIGDDGMRKCLPGVAAARLRGSPANSYNVDFP